jgi:serine-type D-Ala-D-Ala carboxypeptidase/endopeptidase
MAAERRVHAISKIDPKIFDSYVGAYQLAPNLLMAVRREGDRFITQAMGQGSVEIFPEGHHKFFTKVVDAELTFVTDREGRATEMILQSKW